MKVIHAHIFDSKNALFKSNRKDAAECSTIKCSNSENCDLFKRGECSFLKTMGIMRCPYGSRQKEIGFTPKASKYNQWLRDKKEQYKDVPSLKSYSNRIAVVGEYIFLPYSHMNMNERVPFLSHGHIFSSGSHFMKLENFTVNTIISICNFRPQAMMGGEITSYQKEQVPIFIQHLMEQMPDLYSSLCDEYPRAKEVLKTFSHVGRKAILQTLTPFVGCISDSSGSVWVWDGEYLNCDNPKSAFLPVKSSQARLLPLANTEVKITHNDQVNDNTIFLT